MSPQQVVFDSCICEDKKSPISFEMGKTIHKKLLCKNCVNLIKSFSTIKIISEVPIQQ